MTAALPPTVPTSSTAAAPAADVGALDTWPARYRDAHPLRAKSLAMTLFGDAIQPHGGALWLGSLIRLLHPFGINDRLVRTSVYRLAEEGWLVAQRSGRRSLYLLRAAAAQRFQHAHRRIYYPTYLAWSGHWTLIMALPDVLTPHQRADLRKTLLWNGFAALSPTLYIHPNPDTDMLRDALQRAHVRERVFITQLSAHAHVQGRPLSELAQHGWQLDDIAERYRQFLDWFGPLPALIQARAPLEPGLAYQIRTLLIHAYRRAQLHDPLLPIELLPTPWVGQAAYELCRQIYRLTWAPAEQHILSVLRQEDPHAPVAEPEFHARFGGLA